MSETSNTPRPCLLFAVYLATTEGTLRFRGYCLTREEALEACGSDGLPWADVREEQGFVWRGRAYGEAEGVPLASPSEIKRRGPGRHAA